MIRPKLELNPAVSFVKTATGMVIRSDLGTSELRGGDLHVFADALVPLLDGSRDEETIVAAVEGFTPESVRAFLRLLLDRGVVQEADRVEGVLQRGRQEFFRHWPAKEGADPLQRLNLARVLVVGLEPWSVIAAHELARVGIGALHLVDSSLVEPTDVGPATGFLPNQVGKPRAEVLSLLLRDAYPDCRIAHDVHDPAQWAGAAACESADLMIVGLERDSLRALDAVSRFAQARGVAHVFAFMDDLDAVVGPSVVPGQTACWNCYRLRRLANEENQRAMHELQRSLLRQTKPARGRGYLGAMHGLLGNLLALEATRLISRYSASELVGRQLVQNLVSLQTTVHGVVRMPWCDVCGGSAGSGTKALANSEELSSDPGLNRQMSPDQIRERLAGWVDERTGIVRHLVLNYADPREPELPRTATAIAAAYTDGHFHGHGDEPEPEIGSGKGFTPAEAMIGAVGEAIERYSAARYRREDLHRACFEDLSEDAIDPRTLGLYSDEQYALAGFPYGAFDSKQPLDWVRGRWLDTGKPVWVPALVAYFNFYVPHSERFCQVSSNGLAAGADDTDAALRASLELIERDAFMLTWLAKRPARAISTARGLEPQTQEVLRQLEERCERVELYDVDVDLGVPVVACVAFGDGKSWPGATVALAAHLDPAVAVRKAVFEQGHVGPYIRRLMAADPAPAIPRAADEVRSLTDHALYYIPADRATAFDFLRAAKETIELDAPLAERQVGLAALRERIATKVRIATVDVTSPDVMSSPFRVARAVGVGMQQIEFGHHLRRLPGKRLASLLDRRAPNANPHPVA